MSIDGYTDNDPNMDQVDCADDLIVRLHADLEDARLRNAELQHALHAEARQRRHFEAMWRDEKGRRREADASLRLVERRLRDARDENLRLMEQLAEERDACRAFEAGLNEAKKRMQKAIDEYGPLRLLKGE